MNNTQSNTKIPLGCGKSQDPNRSLLTDDHPGDFYLEGSPEMEKSGYVKLHRKIQESDIAHAPPHIREIWNYLILEANHADSKRIKRGQCLRTYRDIREALSWNIGWRKTTYSKSQCENAMKYLRKHTMIATQRTTHGLLITLLNYDKYNRQKDTECHTENETRATHVPHTCHSLIEQEEKNKRIKNTTADFVFPDWLDKKLWSEFKKYRQNGKGKFTPFAQELAIKKLEKFRAAGHDPSEVIKQSILHGWSGLFEIKKEVSETRSHSPIADKKLEDFKRMVGA